MPRTEYVHHERDLANALKHLGFNEPRRVIVVVGGAAGLTGATADAIAPLVENVIVPICEDLGATLVDGGTDSGVMRVVGRARRKAQATFALVGITAAGTIAGSGATVEEPADLEPNHTHFLIVPGSAWGDESPWIAQVAATLAHGRPAAGVLFGGGAISRQDVANLTRAGFAVFAIGGSGRLADALAAPMDAGDPVVDALRASDLVTPVDGLEDPAALRSALRAALEPS